MSDCFNHEADAWDDLMFGRGNGEEDFFRSRPRRGISTSSPSSETCKFCGIKNLKWVKTKTGWRLYDGGLIHSCDQYEKD